jgi:hypothetical protein
MSLIGVDAIFGSRLSKSFADNRRNDQEKYACKRPDLALG